MKLKLTNEPLGLPRGSVRALIALILIIGFTIYILLNNSINDAFLSVVSLVVGNYFGTRSSETKDNPAEPVLPDAV